MAQLDKEETSSETLLLPVCQQLTPFVFNQPANQKN
jgi:hypothetical protein